MQILDLFCGAGGAAMGIHQACPDAIIVGVDIEPQPEYPFTFIQTDVLSLPFASLDTFDFIWASPPCQCYSLATVQVRKTGRQYPDLVGATRELLLVSAKPFVIENVVGAPIRRDLLLCGVMFGLKVIRHRIFEIEGFWCWQPEHLPHLGLAKDCDYVTVTKWGNNNVGHNYNNLKGMEGKTRLEVRQHAMGIDWITNDASISEAVPPAYSEYIFRQFLNGRLAGYGLGG